MNFDKNQLTLGYGLSCIENYIVYLLKDCDPDWEYIFYKSYLSFAEIFDEFYSGQKQYSYFDRIPRIQQVGRELEKIDIRMIRNVPVEDLLEQWSVAAIRVTPEYIAEKYQIKLWRDDHFILLKQQEDGLYQYINDNPRDEGVFSPADIKRIYAGETIAFDLQGNELAQSRKLEIFRHFHESVVNSSSGNGREFSGEIDIQMLRDILGVLRVIVKRTEALCGKFFDSGFLEDYYNYLDEKFTKLEYMRLRGRYSIEKLHEIINSIYIKEELIKKQLIERLEVVNENYRG